MHTHTWAAWQTHFARLAAPSLIVLEVVLRCQLEKKGRGGRARAGEAAGSKWAQGTEQLTLHCPAEGNRGELNDEAEPGEAVRV